jgi:hypothetical protein
MPFDLALHQVPSVLPVFFSFNFADALLTIESAKELRPNKPKAQLPGGTL